MISLLKRKKKEKLPARLRGNCCLNCNVTLEGEENFCPNCGQRNNINQLSFKLFVDEFFGDMFSYDSRLWGTVFPLILKPGKVAYEFVAGKRKEFVNPFRTYLTVSLIFFLIFGLMNTIDRYNSDGTTSKNAIVNFNSGLKDGFEKGASKTKKDSIINDAMAQVKEDAQINLDSTLRANTINLDSVYDDNISLDTIKKKAAEQNKFIKKVTSFYDYYEKNNDYTVTQALDSLGYPNTFWNRFYYDKSISSNEMMKDKGESFNQKIFSGLSIAIFIFLPVFALFFKLIYLRRKYTYMEHMVFVFYTQSVFFLLMLLFLIVNFIFKGNDSLIAIFLVMFAVYIFLAMKHFYKQGWFKTFVKFLLVNFSFIVMSSFGLAILTLISFIFY